MKKVSDVMNEIDEIKLRVNDMARLVGAMTQNKELATMISHNTGLSIGNLRDVRNTLAVVGERLETQLRNCKVNM